MEGERIKLIPAFHRDTIIKKIEVRDVQNTFKYKELYNERDFEHMSD